MINKMNRWCALFEEATQIIESDASWLTKYNLLFSYEIVYGMHDLFCIRVPLRVSPEVDCNAWYAKAKIMYDEYQKILGKKESIANYYVRCICGWGGNLYDLDQHTRDALCPKCSRVLLGSSSPQLGG
jgi:hypothetical protein